MTKKMLIDATHPEETRVAVVDGTRLEEFDFEIASRRQIKSNIYLAKVTRVEPSLQSAFVEYGGNRHGFLPFPEIHPDYYRIPVGDRRSFDDDHRWRDDRWDGPAQEPGDALPRVVEHDDAPAETYNADSYGAESDAGEDRGPDRDVAPEGYSNDEPVGEYAAYAAESETSDSDEDAAPFDDAARAVEDSSGFADTIAADAASDPVISEEAFDAGRADDDAGSANDQEPAGEQRFSSEASLPLDGETGAAAEITVDIVGGDDVEDAQRRRRSQMPRYKIQEVIKRRQIMLVQVSKEERGNKGAAVTTFLSLPGRYCVLMPNTSRGGGVSRKIANPADRKRMKELISDLEVPEGMSVILRTAGVERSKAEIKRDLEYLLRLWENIRTLTLESTAPALIYEEGNLVKRAIRDLYTKDIDSIEIAGEEGYRQAKDFMRMLMPSHAKRVQPYRDPSVPLFHRYQVETQIDLIHNPVAHLRSGGYIVINQTEALVSIDVNSGRSTRERNIEETALKTNCEAADEIARQLRLRDMGGLIVIDFIDMDEPRHDAQVERRLKEAMKNDRARIQVGRISPFGLLELSRQRLHPSLIETNFHTCAHCLGTGLVRSIESAALLVLRAIEEEGIKRRSAELGVTVAGNIALYILNQKRGMLIDIEQRYGFSVRIMADDSLIAPEHRIERIRAKPPGSELPPSLSLTKVMAADEDEDEAENEAEAEESKEVVVASAPAADPAEAADANADGKQRKRRRNRRRRGRDGRPEDQQNGDGAQQALEAGEDEAIESAESGEQAESGDAPDGEAASSEEVALITAPTEGEGDGEAAGRRRRRGRRGGRSRPRREDDAADDASLSLDAEARQAEPFAPEHEAAAIGPAESGITAEGSGDSEPASPDAPPAVSGELDAYPNVRESWPEAESIDLIAPTEPEPAEAGAAETPKDIGVAPAVETAPEPAERVAPTDDTAQEDSTSSDEIIAETAADAGDHPAANGAAIEHAPAPANYEIVNRPPEQPRRGWWKRLVE